MKTSIYVLLVFTCELLSCNSRRDAFINEYRMPVDSEEEEALSNSEGAGKLPDIVFVSGSQRPGFIIKPKSVATFVFKVKNIGQVDYNGFVLVEGIGGVSGGCQGLKRGETKEVVVKFTAHSKSATYTLKFDIDPYNVIAESNESNNRSRAFTVKTTL
jgi:hypothetical protein